MTAARAPTLVRPERTSPARGATLAAIITRIELELHKAGVLAALAEQVFDQFSTEHGGPAFLVKIGGRAPAVADSNALIEIEAMLRREVESSQRRTAELLARTVPGEELEGEATDDDAFQVTVVPVSAATAGERRSW